MDHGENSDTGKRVLVVDPQPIFRRGFIDLLKSAYEGWAFTEADTLDNHRTLLIGGVFDLLIVESQLLGAEFGHDAQSRRRVNLSAGIVAVTEHGDLAGALGCIAAGAHATFARTDSTNRVMAAIQAAVAQPERPATLPLVDRPPTDGAEPSEILKLTARQLDLLRLLALGRSNKVIARDLGLSVSTVKVHLHTVFRALGARNRVDAVVRARPFQAPEAQARLLIDKP